VAVLAVSVLMLSGVNATAGAETAAPPKPWMNASLPPDIRAERLLVAMTLEEKVELMTGDQGEAPSAFYNAPIPRLGIPELRMADAGGGVASRGWELPVTGDRATAFPAGINLGATWNPRSARAYAGAVAKETRATGHAMLLGPGSDMGRQPFWGRIGEGMSEDPVLTASMTTPYVREIQSNAVIATLKHYAGYTQEVNRGNGQNSIIDERALHEVYTYPYSEAIQKADLGSVMCSFNKINDVFACESDVLLDQVLRQELGFTGFVITDFGAIHSTEPSIRAGTDMETGTAAFYGDALLQAVQDGRVPESLVDRSVRRILRTMFAIGVFDNDYTPTSIPVAKDGAVAGRVQDEAVTLLQNKRGVLPLRQRQLDSVAVIGGDANVTAIMGGSFAVKPTYQVSVLDALRKRGARTGVTVRYASGNDPVNGASMLETSDMTAVPSTVLTPETGTGTGLTARHFGDTAFGGDPVTRVEDQVLYDTGFTGGQPAFASLYSSQVPPVPAISSPLGGGQSVRYTGFLTPPTTGSYRLGLTGWGDAKVFLNDQLLVDMTGVDGRRIVDATVRLNAGQRYPIRVEYAADRPLVPLQPGSLVLQWAPPAGALSPGIRAAVATARTSDVAVVYVRTYESEERDRVSLKLPQSADQLIAAVSAVNPRTVVVLATAGAVTMPWLDRVPSVLQNYMGGQEEGNSLSRILFGNKAPSGHLPITYPRSEDALPPGVDNPWETIGDVNVDFSEGVNVGYRGYLASGTRPLFPFGYGLSYTSFKYQRLSLTGLTARGRGGAARATVTLRNSGGRAGTEVVQVYAGPLPGVDSPARKLIGYAKVELGNKEQKTVRIKIPRRQLSYWNSDVDAWVTPRGRVRVYVGDSAENVRLSGVIRIR
jgi:beta-glucosidase